MTAKACSAGWTHVVGLIKIGLLSALAAARHNLRLVRQWARATGHTTDLLTRHDPEDLGFEEIATDATDNGAIGPPAQG